jgi:GNAT superfamily N-acetyltransferase
MRRGIGTALLRHALQTAAQGGADEVDVDADPNAAPFYLRRGAVHVGDLPAPIAGEPQRARPQLRFRCRKSVVCP